MACDSRPERFVACPGRLGTELHCTLVELEHLASQLDGSGYGAPADSFRVFPGPLASPPPEAAPEPADDAAKGRAKS